MRLAFTLQLAILASALLHAAAPAADAAGLAPPARRPNVLVIITDDQGYGDLSCNGNERLRTPAIDSLASASVRFTQFIVSPVCAPTRACLLTGRYNHRTGAIDTYLGRAMMHADEVTLAEALKAAGYRTGLFGKWHLGDCYPLRPQDQGFDEVLMHRGGGMVQPGDPPGSSYFDPILQHNGVQKQVRGYCTDVFAGAAIEFITKNRDVPFFAYLATNAPHTPLQVDEALVKPFREAGLDDVTAKIYAMVSNIDANVGRVLAKLDELGLARDTIVVYLHDNGPQQARRFNAGLRGLKGSVYEGGIRSPLFVRYPARFKAAEVKRMAAHIDLMPTLLELCGVAAPKSVSFDGRSLAGLLADPAAAWPERTIHIQWHRGDEPVLYNGSCARGERWKLVNGKELYDLVADPAEKTNLAAAQPGVFESLRTAHEAWFADVNREKRYLPPRIILGSPKEDPVTLTRQDWRGPRAGWNPDSLGHWEVEVAAAGSYDVTLRFAPAKAASKATFKLGTVARILDVPAGASELKLEAIPLPAGPARLEAWIEGPSSPRPIGVHYVDVARRP